VKSHAIRKNKLSAFNGTRTRLFPSLALSRQVKALLRDCKVNLVLDVGAYHGDYCKMLRDRIGYKGAIASFEPSAASFRILKATMKGDRAWRGFPVGLSDSDGTTMLNNYPGREMFNSILPLRKRDAHNYDVDLATRFSERIRLQTIKRLWSEITDGITSPRVFVKMDTQGHDIAVIRGGLKYLPCLVGMQSELPAIDIYEGMVPMHKVLAFYRKLGFAPIGFYPVNTPFAYGGISPEFDVIFKMFRLRKTLST
jgi:FkbM family methyltransferase